ncbi:hypothetical protein [Pollutimonas bauzanensis]|uniref:hypothetical protein n=1 Tax=Pollutimonas bauzanensis TaxID=658167 RepID=UPI00333F4C88
MCFVPRLITILEHSDALVFQYGLVLVSISLRGILRERTWHKQRCCDSGQEA